MITIINRSYFGSYLFQVLCLLAFFFIMFLTSCHREPHTITPKIVLTVPQSRIAALPSAFPDITASEEQTDWGKELFLGKAFAKEGDFYRAITACKRARFLTYKEHITRERMQDIEYSIFLSYYLGRRYEEAIESFGGTSLESLSPRSLGYKPVLFAATDSFIMQKQWRRAEQIIHHIAGNEKETAHTLEVYKNLMQGNIVALNDFQQDTTALADKELQHFLDTFHTYKKSVRKAEVFNAILPGAGYFYVGQKQSAVTSFLLNALFIAASWQFFQHGQVAA